MNLTTKTNTNTLIKYAKDELGLDLAGHKRADVIAALEDAGVLLSEPAPEPAPAQGGDTAESDRGDELKAADYTTELNRQPTRKVKINSTETDKGPVDLGCNGVVNRYARDVVHDMPEPFVESLRNAISTRYRLLADGKTLEPYEVNTYPYQIMD